MYVPVPPHKNDTGADVNKPAPPRAKTTAGKHPATRQPEVIYSGNPPPSIAEYLAQHSSRVSKLTAMEAKHKVGELKRKIKKIARSTSSESTPSEAENQTTPALGKDPAIVSFIVCSVIISNSVFDLSYTLATGNVIDLIESTVDKYFVSPTSPPAKKPNFGKKQAPKPVAPKKPPQTATTTATGTTTAAAATATTTTTTAPATATPQPTAPDRAHLEQMVDKILSTSKPPGFGVPPLIPPYTTVQSSHRVDHSYLPSVLLAFSDVVDIMDIVAKRAGASLIDALLEMGILKHVVCVRISWSLIFILFHRNLLSHHVLRLSQFVA